MKLLFLLKLACSELTVVDPNIINGNHPDLNDCPVNSCYSIFNDVCEVDPSCFNLGWGFRTLNFQVFGGKNFQFLRKENPLEIATRMESTYDLKLICFSKIHTLSLGSQTYRLKNFILLKLKVNLSYFSEHTGQKCGLN